MIIFCKQFLFHKFCDIKCKANISFSLPIPWDEYPDNNADTSGAMDSKKSQNYNWQDKLEEILADLTDEELWFLERGQAQVGFSAHLNYL